MRHPKIWKSWKSWKSWFSASSGSQNTVLELQSAAPRRNVQITCRGGVSNSVSNTPPRQNRRGPHPDFTVIFGRFFLNFSKSLNLFFTSLQFHAGEIFKRGTCKVSSKLKHFRHHFSGGEDLHHETPWIMKIMKILKIMIFSRLWLSERGSGASERCASAQCSNNLQRRGFELCK